MGGVIVIDLDINDVTVQMELNGVFWNEDGIAEMTVTTKRTFSYSSFSS